MGHGIPAALNAMKVITLIKAFANRGVIKTPKMILEELNFNLIQDVNSPQFVTLSAASYNSQTGEMSWCLAGHDKPILLDQNGNTIDIQDTHVGHPLGISMDPLLLEERIVIPQGGIILFPTDGCREVFNPLGTELSEKGLLELVKKYYGLPLQELCDSVVGEILSYPGNDSVQSDDITLVGIKRI